MTCGRTIGAFVCASALLLLWPHRADARNLEDILARGAFSICADPDALPFSQRSGAPAGIQIDLAKLLADRIGVRLDVHWVGCEAPLAGSTVMRSWVPWRKPRMTTQGNTKRRRECCALR